MKVSPSRRSRSSDCLLTLRSAEYALLDQGADPVRCDPVLLQCVAVTNRDRLVLRRLAVHRDAEGRADLVLPAIAAADGAGFVVEHRELLAQLVGELVCELGHAVLLHERKDAG